MSSLAFDKEGRPFQFSPKLGGLGVRRFRNPGGRGTCEVVYDEDGDPLFVEPDCDVADLRSAVGNVPGLYRLDQYDEHGSEIDDAQAAYVAIDPPRNSGSADPLMIVRDLALGHADVAKTLADRHAGMMQAATENMRVTGGAGSRPWLGLLANAAKGLGEPVGGDDDDEEGDDEDDDELGGAPQGPAPSPLTDPMAIFAMLAPILQPALPKIGEAIGNKLAELLNGYLGKQPAAASGSTTATASAPASAPPPSGAPASEAAAGTGARTETTSAPPAAEPAEGPSAPVAPPPAPTKNASATVTDVRNASPTAPQMNHLFAISGRLTPKEMTIVHATIARMDEATRVAWIAELSAMTVDQAVDHVRALLPAAARAETPPGPRERKE